MFPRALKLSISILLAVTVSSAYAAPIIGPIPYLSTADIPAGLFTGPYSLEDFEDGVLSGFTASGSNVFVLPPSGITDSVDADDGAINGSGSLGHSLVGDGDPGLTLTFAGPLPTAAGLVWTDGVANTVVIDFYGPGMALIGSTGVLPLGDEVYFGETAEDRFVGMQYPGGIQAIRVYNPGGQVEVDHVMFGTGPDSPTPVPEPTTLCLLGLGLAGAGARCWRQRKQ